MMYLLNVDTIIFYLLLLHFRIYANLTILQVNKIKCMHLLLELCVVMKVNILPTELLLQPET